MLFSDILGQESLKNYLIGCADSGRIPHAQLFVGPEGSGTLAMAIAYAQYIVCGNKGGENNSGNSSCNIKFNALSHPDLHFIYPVASNQEIKSHPNSAAFFKYWQSFLSDNVYGNLFDWYNHIGIENKQGQIGVEDAAEIVKTLSLKSYEGGYKIMIIWMADKMNTASANKILKILEEPPAKTLFFLITEQEENIMETIRSRCQTLRFGALANNIIAQNLIERRGVDSEQAYNIAHQSQGSYNKALQLLKQDSSDLLFDQWFISWVRAAFKAKGNAQAIHELLAWSENIASLGRETQKKFLQYCIAFFRQALLSHYRVNALVYKNTEIDGFKLENFAPFVHGGNISLIFNALSEAIYHIERNGNSKIILTDLSICLTRLIHKK